MWTRQELKAKGKAAFKGNYWRSMAAGALGMVLAGATFTYRASSGDMEEFQAEMHAIAAQNETTLGLVIAALIAVMGIATLVSMAINIFLRKPLMVGVDRFFLVNAKQPATMKELGYSFSSGRYLKIVGAMVLVSIFISLWSLLLVIPGIIKMFDYYLVSYILADDPDMGVMDALRKSKEMMKGHRWNTFVLNLSFLGWKLLGALTCGLVDLFYTNPYMCATDAELYLALKQ